MANTLSGLDQVGFLCRHGDSLPGHLLDAVCPVVLVVYVTSHILEVMHVSADEHVAKLHEVAVRLILHCGAGVRSGWVSPWGAFPPGSQCPGPRLTLHDPPGVQSTPDSLPFGLHYRVAANNSEGSTLLRGGEQRPSWVSMQAEWLEGVWGTAPGLPSRITITNAPPRRSWRHLSSGLSAVH